MGVINFDLDCLGCVGSLRGTATHAACPRCQLPVYRTLALGAIDERQMTVAGNVPCRGCDYNLFSQPVWGRCPECGGPVVDSLRGNDLLFLPMQVLGNLRGVLSWQCFWLVGSCLCPLVIMISPFMLMMGVLGLIEQLTESAPTEARFERYRRSLRPACGGAVLFLFLSVALGAHTHRLPISLAVVLVVGALISWGVVLCVMAGALSYLGARAHRPRLSVAAKVVSWLTVSVGVMFIGIVMMGGSGPFAVQRSNAVIVLNAVGEGLFVGCIAMTFIGWLVVVIWARLVVGETVRKRQQMVGEDDALAWR